MNRALLDLQHLDSSILNISRQKNALDDGTAAAERLDKTTSELEAARLNLKRVEKERQARENELSATEDKLTRQKARMMNASNAGDISALERDIVGLSHARGELDEAILMLMDETEGAEKEVARLQKELKLREEELEKVETDFAKQEAELDAALARKRANRPSLASKLSPVESEKYLVSFKKHGGLGVSQTIKGACDACGTTQSMQFLREAPKESFPQCEHCGRLIFVE